MTLGRHGVISADLARRKGALTIARMKQGQDLNLAPSGWVVDPVPSQYRRSTRQQTAGTVRQRIISNLVRPDDRPVMSNIRRTEYVVCLGAELLGPD